MQLLKRILTAVVLIPIVLLLVLAAPVPVLAFVTALIALLTTDELLKLSAGYGIHPFRWATYIVVALFFVFVAVNPGGDTPLLSTAGVVYAAGGDPAMQHWLESLNANTVSLHQYYDPDLGRRPSRD